MNRYALLILPSANRVYAESSIALTRAELEVFGSAVMPGRLGEIETAEIGGVPYVVFSAENLAERDVRLLGNLSSGYALFQVDGDLPAVTLRPVTMSPLDRFPDDLITIQKYQGKTNEQFTKLLLNITLLSSAFAGEMLDRRFSVLDPLCGRGTTLNQALMYGFDAAGIDSDRADIEAYAVFIQRWLKDKRIKHRAEFGPVRRNRQVVARRLNVTLAATKEAYKSGDTQRLDVVYADTVKAHEFHRSGTFDLVVTDAPYGVQHGSRTVGKGLARDPLGLLNEALPVWARLLRPGGALGISWNTFVADRDDVTKLVAEVGLEPLTSRTYLDFRHRVDQSIVRDVLVARKPLPA